MRNASAVGIVFLVARGTLFLISGKTRPEMIAPMVGGHALALLVVSWLSSLVLMLIGLVFLLRSGNKRG